MSLHEYCSMLNKQAIYVFGSGDFDPVERSVNKSQVDTFSTTITGTKCDFGCNLERMLVLLGIFSSFSMLRCSVKVQGCSCKIH